MGGGRRHFVPANSDGESGERGRREDNRNLIKTWMANKQKRGLAASYVSNSKELRQLDSSKIDYLMGMVLGFRIVKIRVLKKKKIHCNLEDLQEITSF